MFPKCPILPPPIDEELTAEEIKEERRERKRRKFRHQALQLKNDKLQNSKEMDIPKSQIQDDYILKLQPKGK